MTRYKRGALIGSLVAVGLVLGSAGAALAGTFPGMAGPGWVTARPYGPAGMMGNGEPGGMMNGYGSRGRWSICGTGSMMGGWAQTAPRGRVLSLNQAQRQVQRCIDWMGNPNLAIDEVVEFQRNFYASIKDTSTGHGAFEVLVNKVTGAAMLEPPSMMWNTQYGMMSRGMGRMMGYQQPSGPMLISPAQAEQIARQWLAQHRPGATTEAPDQFPGYYTSDFRQNGTIAGMLSVNGYTGQVWYHTWHGTFIRRKEV
jgi:hypothetical protein